MYPPKQFQENNKELLISVIKTFPLATVITINNDEPFVSHLPLIYKKDTIYGHIDRNNPQANLLGHNNKVTLIFSGPQSYLSPSIFKTKELPTWNYVAAHVKGTVTQLKTSLELKKSIVNMTTQLEAPDLKYQLDINDERMDKLVQYISGFKVENLQWEGKFKLSQDKSLEHFNIAKNEMLKVQTKQITHFINTILKNKTI